MGFTHLLLPHIVEVNVEHPRYLKKVIEYISHLHHDVYSIALLNILLSKIAWYGDESQTRVRLSPP